MQAVAHYGAGWYWNPAGWSTSDGIVPYREFWVWWHGIMVSRAWDRLDMAQAAALPQMEQRERRKLADDLALTAFGG